MAMPRTRERRPSQRVRPALPIEMFSCSRLPKIGRARDWAEVRDEAARAHNERTASYLLGMPMLGDFLEEGHSTLGYSCEDFETERL